MGVRSILIKIVFFNPFVSCSRGPGVLPQPQLNAKSNVHATMPTKRPAADVQPLESKGKIKKGPSKSTEWVPSLRQYQFQRTISRVDPLSLSPREESRAVISASSSRRQGAEARRVKRTRSGKRNSRDTEIGYERAEAEAHLGSPSFHRSGLSSDDPFGEDEVENVRPGHVEALGAAYTSLESEGGAGWRRSFRYQARPYALSKNRHCTTLRVEFFRRLHRHDVP